MENPTQAILPVQNNLVVYPASPIVQTSVPAVVGFSSDGSVIRLEIYGNFTDEIITNNSIPNIFC